VASSSPRAFEYCDEEQRLVDAYAFATADYNRAVQVLQRRRGVMSKTEYERLRAFSEQARASCEQARNELERHTSNHGC
jgi:multidrug resistance efflux pump